MFSSPRRSASASWATAMNALLRWETSITDMPLDFQSVISDWACWRTSSGSVAGPAAKLKTRMVYSSSRTLLPDRLFTPDVIARGRGIYQDVGVSVGPDVEESSPAN